MKAFIRNNSWFFIPYAIVLALSAGVLMLDAKGQLNILLDKNHSKFWDHFFVQYTNFGDGITAALFCVILFFVSKRWALGLSAAMIAVSVVSQVLKKVVIEVNPRPRQFFKDVHEFRDIEWLTPHLWDSMPSGHTTAAFCLFAFLAFISRKKIYGYTCFLLAALVAFSRVYLAQHFLDDVVAGSIIGIGIAMIFYHIFAGIKKYPYFDQPLIKDSFEKF